MRSMIALALAALLAQPALIQAAQPTARSAAASERLAQSPLPEGDRIFAEEAARSGLKEVRLGEIAVERAASPEVAAFAERMVQDHNQANERLRAIAGRKEILLPGRIDQDTQHMLDELGQLSGAEFDRAYMDQMVRDHEADIAAFQVEAESGQDPDLRAFAQATLPVLQEHLGMAREIQASVSGAVTPRPR